MALYKYVKAPFTSTNLPNHQPKKQHNSKIPKLVPPVLITLGSVILANVLGPIISYQLITAPKIKKTEFVAPVAETAYGPNTTIQSTSTPQTKTIYNTPTVLGAEDLDYTQPQNWFPQAPYQSEPNDNQLSYFISIPKINIQNAEVFYNGQDLDTGLIQYPGTAMPGQLGSPVIFGHSILRQFYNPSEKNPNRYTSIFSKIMTLKPGDEIYIDFDGIQYTYQVKDKVEVKPEDVFILEQHYNNRELKLITCVPEGTYLRRGVLIAQLVDLE